MHAGWERLGVCRALWPQLGTAMVAPIVAPMAGCEPGKSLVPRLAPAPQLLPLDGRRKEPSEPWPPWPPWPPALPLLALLPLLLPPTAWLLPPPQKHVCCCTCEACAAVGADGAGGGGNAGGGPFMWPGELSGSGTAGTRSGCLDDERPLLCSSGAADSPEDDSAGAAELPLPFIRLSIMRRRSSSRSASCARSPSRLRRPSSRSAITDNRLLSGWELAEP